MRLAKKRALGGLSAALLAMVIPFAPHASAATVPPWEPDPNGSNGSITFFDAAGNVVTGGSNLAHLFDYAMASSAATRTTTKAQTTFAFPDHTKADSTTWFQSVSSAATTFPNAAYPGTLGTTTHPVAHAASTEANLNALLTTVSLDNTTGYAGIVQVRMKDSGVGIGNGVLASPFWETDIAFNQAAGTWTQVYPAPPSGPTATSTALSASPASPQMQGSAITLTATMTPSAAAGTVQFKDGSADIGTAATVTGGHASTVTSSLPAGPHSLTAVFTPTDATAFSPSTSPASSYVITAPATTTTTTLQVTPPTPITVGTSSTLTADVAPSDAVGSVQFVDGATNIGSPVVVNAGVAVTTTSFAVNTHSLKAVFTPTDATAFTASQSAAASYVVNPAPATSTTTSLSITESSPQVFGTTLHLTGTVSPSNAVGAVQFLDGTTVIATGTVAGGVATGSSNQLVAGDHSLTAKFVPADPANFGTSQSPADPFTTNPAASTTSLAVAPTSPVVQGTQVTLTATTGPSGQAGLVQFFDGASTLGAPVTVVSNHASFPSAALAVGPHSFTATFTPTSGNFAPSTSAPLSFTVNPPPPGTTTTALSVAPGGPVGPQTLETLSATVSPSTAAGTVTFRDGATPVGSPVAVTGGHAQTTTTLAVGTHQLTADFVSSDQTKFLDSSSATLSFVVKPPAQATQTALAATPTSPVAYGTSVTLTASVTPSAAIGSVQFFDGLTSIGSANVAAGTATLITIGLHGGNHALTATFTPSTPLDFVTSTSAAVSFDVTAVTTTTSLALSPGSPVTAGTSVKLTATVSPSTAVGSVSFSNGNTVLGSAAVKNGVAVWTTSVLPEGAASLTAAFTATHTADLTSSASDPSTLDVVAPPTLDSVETGGHTVSNGATLTPGQSLTIDAGGFQPGETVDIAVHSTIVHVGSTIADSTGAVHVTVALPSSLSAGTHELTLTGAIGSVTLTFKVAATSGTSGATTGGGQLSATGADVLGGTGLALALLVGGIAALRLGSRRRLAITGRHRAG